MPLAEAKTDLETWWAELRPRIGQGHRVQKGLNDQIQRLALDSAHKIAQLRGLSEADTKALIAHAITHCEPPRVKDAPSHILPRPSEDG